MLLEWAETLAVAVVLNSYQLMVLVWQVLHLIRHGEGYHNVAGRRDHSLYSSWEYEDAHLTQFGWEQVCVCRWLLNCPGLPTQ